MEDDLMRIFGADRIKNLMNTFGIPDDQPIENGMVSRAIETAQKKVEGHNFDIRKHVLEYDDVMNKQRKAIYSRRDKVLSGRDDIDGIEVDLIEKVKDVSKNEVEILVDVSLSKADDFEEAKKEVWTNFCILIEKEKIGISFEEFNQLDNFDQLKTKLTQELDNQLEKVVKDIGEDETRKLITYLYLRVIDMFWVQHLTEMDHLRTGIGLVGYGQKDPLVEYKHRSYGMFKQLVGIIDSNFVRTFYRIKVEPQKNQTFVKADNQKMEEKKESTSLLNDSSSETKKPDVIGKGKTGRNDPCPCGSGKKYKKCCGKDK
jgi:preprotein translocase subunit SecA